MADDADQLILILLCIFVPPLGVYFKTRECDINVLIALLLCLLFWIPGVVFAFWFCLVKNK